MDIREADSLYVANTYGRFDALMESGSGAVFTDEAGRQYIDMGSGIGVNVFGACDPVWTAAVEEQLHKLAHTSNLYYTEPCVRLAKLLCEKTGMKKVFFGNSGAEANEGAIKVARKYGNDASDGKRNVIVTLQNSFHGRTIATLKATGQAHFHQHFGPFPEGFRYVPANDAAALTEALSHDDVCGLMLEIVQGEGGVNTLDPDYLALCDRLCHEKDIVFIIDEVQTGNGRTGSLYAYQQFGLRPDVVSTAKGLGGGLPIGAVLMGEKVQYVLGKGDHGSTFGGNPICAAGACSVIERLDDTLLAEVREKAACLRAALEKLPGVKSVSGLGLMIGIETERPAGDIVKECLADGLMLLTAKTKVRLLPPLTITYEQIDAGLEILARHLV